MPHHNFSPGNVSVLDFEQLFPLSSLRNSWGVGASVSGVSYLACDRCTIINEASYFQVSDNKTSPDIISMERGSFSL